MKMNFWKVSALVLTVFLTLSLLVNVIFILKGNGLAMIGISFSGDAGSSLIEPVSAEEVYPLFQCPCCGKPIDTRCCGLALERQVYVDGLVQGQLSKDEIVATYVKKYGLDSFIDKEKQKEFREKLVKEAPVNRQIISLSPEFFDFGDVSQKEGKVFTYFDLKNEGKSDLVIDKLETSCGCTFAAIIFGGEESPLFTMPGHGEENPTDWTVSIPSGETAQLKVYYDPDTHKDFRGPATREVNVFSNDPIDFEKKVTIELNQID